MKRATALRRILVTDGSADARRILETVRIAYEGGIRAFQFRERTMGDRESLRLLRDLRDILPRGKALLFVNDRIDLCHACGGDGVQLGFRSVSSPEARKILGNDAWVGASIHTAKEALEAANAGADFALFGPVFATPSKEGILPPAGLQALSRTVRLSPIPVVAIGGIEVANAAETLATGCVGVACIREIFEAINPRKRVRDFVEVSR